jgi:hypothetical protein
MIGFAVTVVVAVWSDQKIKRRLRAKYPFCPMVTTDEWSDFTSDRYTRNNISVLYEIYTLPHQNYNLRSEMKGLLLKGDTYLHIKPMFFLAAVDHIKGNGWGSILADEMCKLHEKIKYQRYCSNSQSRDELCRMDTAFTSMPWYERFFWNAMVGNYRFMRYNI